MEDLKLLFRRFLLTNNIKERKKLWPVIVVGVGSVGVANVNERMGCSRWGTLVLPVGVEFSNTVIVLKRDRSVGLGLSKENKH